MALGVLSNDHETIGQIHLEYRDKGILYSHGTEVDVMRALGHIDESLGLSGPSFNNIGSVGTWLWPQRLWSGGISLGTGSMNDELPKERMLYWAIAPLSGANYSALNRRQITCTREHHVL